jgi:hypothetical protein
VTSALLEAILARLDVVVLERLPDGVFLRVGSAPPPAWFSDVMRTAGESRPITVGEALPFVGQFLHEAENFWREGPEERLRSDPFVAATAGGADVGLVASAVVIGQRQFLIIELSRDFDERRRALQSARENVLEHDAHVRRTGALLTPIGAAQKLVQQLADSGLTPAQGQLADDLRTQLAAVSEAVESLAPLPKGVSRAQRR